MATATIIVPIRISNPIYEVYLTNLVYCLSAVTLQQYTYFEAILVDYGSCPDYVTKLQVLATNTKFKYVRAEGEIWSRSKALNIGIQNSSGEYVLFVDADCVIPVDYITACLSLCSPSTFSFSTVYDSLPGIVPSSYHAELLQRVTNQGVKTTRDCGFSHMCVNRNWLITNLGYNELYSGWGGEDNDLFLRLNRSGYKEKHVDVHPIHLWHPTYEELMKMDGQKELYDRLLVENRTRYFNFRDGKSTTPD